MAEKIQVLIPEEKLEARIKEIGRKISEDYAGREILIVCVLRGGVFFACELAKHITVPVRMDFMSVSSYEDGTESLGRVKILKDLDENLEGRDVLIVEDIVDSGNTLHKLMRVLEVRRPASLKLRTMLDKPERRTVEIPVDYTCFEIPDAFVVGYGLDYAQKYRNLPYIGVLDLGEGI